jgi:hypothetical protein
MAHNHNPATEQNIMQWKQRENLAQQKVYVCNCILEITVTYFDGVKVCCIWSSCHALLQMIIKLMW